MPLTLSQLSFEPQGRLTLTTVVPVLSAAVATSANVLYTPYKGNTIPLWDGLKWVPATFPELTNVLANSATGNAGPAAGAASKNYDLFVWNNNGTPTLTRGAAWFSDTARSTATENDLQRIQGYLCNLNAITNGPAAGYGLFIGTVRTDAGGATVSFSQGGAATGGTPATFHLWNMYNRVIQTAVVRETTASWGGAYTSASFQSVNASVGNRCSMIRGLNDENVDAFYSCYGVTAAVLASYAQIGVGLDITNNASGPGMRLTTQIAGANSNTIISHYHNFPGLGFHFLQAVEGADGTNATTWYGNAASLQGLHARVSW